MYQLEPLPRILTYVFLVTSMLAIGLQSSLAELRSLVGGGLFLRSFLANFVLVPLAGFALVRLVPMPAEVAQAFMLLACTPGGISTAQFASKVRGESAFAGAIVAALSFAALILSPVLIALVIPGAALLHASLGRAATFVIGMMLVPLAIGIWIRDRAPGSATRLAKPLAILGSVAFVATVVLLLSWRKAAMTSIGKPAVLIMLVFIVVCMLIGWLLGGPTTGTRRILANATSMRNVGLCFLFALEIFPNSAVTTPLLAFSALMVPPNMIFTVVANLIGKRRARAGASPT
jgi:BASS family bile acid:Na+ symporter